MKSINTEVLPESTERHGNGVRDETRLLHHEITRPIIGTLFSIHSELGIGYLEAVYANSVCVLLRKAGLKVQREVPFDVSFQGETVGRYRADIVVESKVIVEVKTARLIHPAYEAQLVNYLRTSNLRVGLILNFGVRPSFKRLIA